MTVTMGRTKRKRNRKPKEKNIEDWDSIVNLQKALKIKFTNLKVDYFDDTGRGVKCIKRIQEGVVLISLPLHQLITRNVSSELLTELSLEDKSAQFILSMWLVYEAHLKEESKYFTYIQSLPQYYTNLFFCSQKEENLLPEVIKKEFLSQKSLIEEVTKELFEVLGMKSCPHCSCSLKDVYGLGKFFWAWFTVNTRSVYYKDELNVESLALAPFLDLFNHSNDANTKMIIDFENKSYILKTLVSFDKFQQVFIKYGSHSNLKLLIEYGFVVPNNCHDFVEFTFEEIIKSVKEIDSTFGELSKLKYNFIKANKLDKNLTKSKDEFSWNFYGLVYTLITSDQDFSVFASKVYSTDFSPTDWGLFHKVEKIILAKKRTELENHLLKMEAIKDCSLSFSLAKDLLKIYINLLI